MEGARTRRCPAVQSQAARGGGVMSHTAQSPRAWALTELARLRQGHKAVAQEP